MTLGKKLRGIFAAVAGGSLLGCGPVTVYRQPDIVYAPPRPPVVERIPEPVYVEPVQPRSLYYSSSLDCYVDPFTSNVTCYDVVFPRYGSTTPPLWLDFHGDDNCYYPRGYGRYNSPWIGVIDSPRLGITWGLALGDVLIFSSHGRHHGAYYNYNHRRDHRDRHEYRDDHRRHDRDHDRRDRDRHDERRDRDDKPRYDNHGNWQDRDRQNSPAPPPKQQRMPRERQQQQERERQIPSAPRPFERAPRLDTLPDVERPRQQRQTLPGRALPDVERPRQQWQGGGRALPDVERPRQQLQRQDRGRGFQGGGMQRAPRQDMPQRQMPRFEGQRRGGDRQNNVNRGLPRHGR